MTLACTRRDLPLYAKAASRQFRRRLTVVPAGPRRIRWLTAAERVDPTPLVPAQTVAALELPRPEGPANPADIPHRATGVAYILLAGGRGSLWAFTHA